MEWATLNFLDHAVVRWRLLLPPTYSFGTLPHKTDGTVPLRVQNCGRAKFRRGPSGPLNYALGESCSALCVPLSARKEEERPALTETTGLLDRGDLTVAHPSLQYNAPLRRLPGFEIRTLPEFR
jgi:hypothetical protein